MHEIKRHWSYFRVWLLPLGGLLVAMGAFS